MNNLLRNLTVKQLQRAAALKLRIETLERDLTKILGIPEPLTVGGTVRRHQRLAKAATTKLSAAAKTRWAKISAVKT